MRREDIKEVCDRIERIGRQVTYEWAENQMVRTQSATRTTPVRARRPCNDALDFSSAVILERRTSGPGGLQSKTGKQNNAKKTGDQFARQER